MSEGLDNVEITDLALQSPILIELAHHWETAKATNSMPARADISPLDLGPKLIPHVMIAEIEHHGQDDMRVLWRLIGTHITQTVGRDVTGAYWDEVYDEEVLSLLLLRVEWVLKHHKPLHSYGISPNAKFKAGSSTSVYLPLSDDGVTINMILIGSDYSLERIN